MESCDSKEAVNYSAELSCRSDVIALAQFMTSAIDNAHIISGKNRTYANVKDKEGKRKRSCKNARDEVRDFVCEKDQ